MHIPAASGQWEVAWRALSVSWLPERIEARLVAPVRRASSVVYVSFEPGDNSPDKHIQLPGRFAAVSSILAESSGIRKTAFSQKVCVSRTWRKQHYRSVGIASCPR